MFYLLMLKQDITKKWQIDNNIAIQLKFEVNNNKKYSIKAIQNNIIYEKEFKAGHFSKLYYLILWKS